MNCGKGVLTIARETNALHGCVKKFWEVNKPRFACVSLGKCRFWLISFDVPFCLKRNLEGNIVSLIAGTYPNFKKFYTSEVEKSPKNYLSLRKRRQKRVCLPPLLITEEIRKMRAQIFFELRERCISLFRPEKVTRKCSKNFWPNCGCRCARHVGWSLCLTLQLSHLLLQNINPESVAHFSHQLGNMLTSLLMSQTV